jgi:hypothetical protein
MALRSRLENLERQAAVRRNPSLSAADVEADLRLMAGTIQPPPELALSPGEAVDRVLAAVGYAVATP